ncbi:BREX-1 system adenine-specific DNA-methyltransferase PglX [Pseudoalteromonas sp. NZS71]|uniref:BREX-1 system adenine-specific DNA-methyltransferase PglX n=1 Tax=Pseudoalteromonas sp. NZS71 TaxID=2792052 RepID=UPI0018CFDEAE|nr:BREX-1 system adenine-specific DNA-methyltransferase PglX [Pseudoalteromonas sp. NZS71]MBH0060561.1 BREX-1 system adenine-specific DNA-methyltransferase PglX [Pseudoalteromonas sp. NZS71]
MKLSDHVNRIRNLITASFDKQFARLGIGANKQIELEKLPEQVRGKRQHLEVMLENHIGETGCYQDAREKLLDELSFTLFNRLAAVKVMESANLFPPVITKQAEHGGRSFGHKAWLEEYPENRESELEGIRDYFKHAFNELGDSLPLYSKEYPYALLPDAISLNEIIEAFNVIAEDSNVEDDIWQSDDVLGWLYESYNNAKKQAFKDSKAKTEYDKVSLQSQVYTPRWVVQFLVENSLGKLYLEMYPESEIKNQFKIANAPKIQERDLKPLHEIKLIDPASGSGNFLLYAFDFFYELYIDQIENYDADYDEDDIPKLIIENNLYGIDLDDRAIQLAQLGLYIKARKKRRFIKDSFNFKVVSSDFYLPEYDEARHIFEDGGNLDITQKELIEDIWNDLRYAYKFGSLIRLDEKLKAKLKELESKQGEKVLDLFADADIREQKDFTELFLNNLKAAVEKFACKDADTFIASKTRDAITFLELLTTEYDVACANPPYTDSGDFGVELKNFSELNYKKPIKFSSNLYSIFLKRCCELTSNDGMVAMIHPDTIMFIKSFENVRNFILKNHQINTLIHYPQTGGVFGIGLIYPVFYVIDKSQDKSKKSLFVNLKNSKGTKEEAESLARRLNDYIKQNENLNNYSFFQDELKKVQSSPFIYWISDEFRKKFNGKNLGNYFDISFGLKTADNLKYLKYSWEVSDFSKRKYDSLYKAGPYNRWFGNLWLTLDYDYQEANISREKSSGFSGKANYKKLGIICPTVAAKATTFRMNYDSIFSNADLGIYQSDKSKNIPILSVLAYLNSKVVQYINNMLNPTVNIMPNDLKRIPFVRPNRESERMLGALSQKCIDIKMELCTFEIINNPYEGNPICRFKGVTFEQRIKEYLTYENFSNSLILIAESMIDDIIFDTYELTPNDKELILEKEGKGVANLPVCKEAKSLFLQECNNGSLSVEVLKPYIESLQEVEFESDYRARVIESLSSLYQVNKSLEEFCIEYQLNPITIWYWFKNVNALPKKRFKSICVDFISSIVRDLLLKDEDGIIPLVSNSGEKILIERIQVQFNDEGYSNTDFSNMDSMLEMPFKKYLNSFFFKDLTEHLNLFQYLPKTPFIWHLTSGPMQGFDCYISIYKWSRDNLMRIRSVYVEHRERALMNRQSDLANNESVDAQNEKDKIFKQLKEIEAFKVKIDELLEEGYNPILENGVGRNIAPLQKKKILAYDVLNAGQLKKYLNADW